MNVRVNKEKYAFYLSTKRVNCVVIHNKNGIYRDS